MVLSMLVKGPFTFFHGCHSFSFTPGKRGYDGRLASTLPDAAKSYTLVLKVKDIFVKCIYVEVLQQKWPL